MDFKVTSQADKQAVYDYIGRLPEGKEYDISVCLHRVRRTVSQNRLYRLWLSCISRETGNDLDDLHRFLAGKFLGFQEHNVFGVKVHTPVSTASLSTEQFTEFLDRVQAFATSEGIILPNPDDRYWETFLKQYNND